MGDTLPKSFKYYDIRAKYNEKVDIFSSAHQEFGRIAGYLLLTFTHFISTDILQQLWHE